jgi:DNA-binding transcriptional ArsR family regulator
MLKIIDELLSGLRGIETLLCSKIHKCPKTVNTLYRESFLRVLSDKDSRTIGGSLEETRQFHVRYLRAVNSPIRRKILLILKEEEATLPMLQTKTGMSAEDLDWHLRILEYGFCVEHEAKNGETFYRLTKEGSVVDFLKA